MLCVYPGSTLIVNEYCNMQPVNMSCSSRHQVILIRRARYGRMQLGSCVQRNLGYIGCSLDVLPQLDARCSARRRCSFSLPDPELYATRPCPVDTTSYLEVAYECLQGIRQLLMCGTSISVCNQPPRSTQPGHPFVGRRNEYTSQRAVTTCGWEVKAGVRVWVAGKTV